MKNVTKIIAAIVSALTLAFQVPAVQAAVGAFLSAHVTFASIVGGIAAVLALLHNPVKQ